MVGNISKHSSKYDPSIHDELDKVDWSSVFPPVLKYARARSLMLKWLGIDVDPEELVNEAVAMAYGRGARGTFRNWNRKKCPELEVFLMGIIKSISSHMVEHASKFPEESLFDMDGTIKDDKIFKSEDKAKGSPRPKNPEDELIIEQSFQSLKNELDKISNDNEELGMLILCIEDGYSKTRHIAEQIGYTREKVNNLKRKLRYRLKDFDPKL